MNCPAGWRIGLGSAAYPAPLRDLDRGQRPVLHGVGDREALIRCGPDPVVTIVGSRRASAYGLRTAEALAHDLALAGVTVVSGMALGIDAAAHAGALAAGGRTVAVLAGGPDVAYPSSNRALHARIGAAGAVVSEHPPGSRPLRHHFVQRNRIMAALAQVIVIVEAALPSGSMTTADLGLRLGRMVTAVPGQVGVRVAEGSNSLIKDGAELIRDARDVLDLLFGVGVAHRPGNRVRGAPGPRPGPPLTESLARVRELIAAGSCTLDRLAHDGGFAPREVAASVARLELLGYVHADPLGGWATTGLEPPRQ